MKKLIIIDGNHLFHRAFWAIQGMKTQDGTPINAVFGFFSMLFSILSREKPDYIVIAFDHKSPTFRHKEYKDYKSTRKKSPDELKIQFPILHDFLKTFKIAKYEYEGYEADDIIGTFADQAQKNSQIMTYIITGDQDILQLVNNKIHVISPKNGYKLKTIYTPEEIKKKFQLTADQIIDYKSLCGDPSDAIKGVQGIGPKNATNLLIKYSTLENIYEHLDEIKENVKRKLENGKEDAFHAKYLVTIQKNLPLKLDLEIMKFENLDYKSLISKFQSVNFFSLIRRIEKLNEPSKNEPSKEDKITNMAKEVFQKEEKKGVQMGLGF